jgi:hypothetical protein
MVAMTTRRACELLSELLDEAAKRGESAEDVRAAIYSIADYVTCGKPYGASPSDVLDAVVEFRANPRELPTFRVS